MNRILTTTILTLSFIYLNAQSSCLFLKDGTIINSNGSKSIQKGGILIEGESISQIGKTGRIKAPEGCESVDLQGKYVIPGLIDGHIHFFQSGGLYTRPDALDFNSVYTYEEEQQYLKSNLDRTFRRYLQSGITGVADVGGGMWNFEVRRLAQQSEVAPRVIVAGPLISTIDRVKLDIGDPPIIKVTSEQEVDELIAQMVQAEADLVKIWFIAFEELDFEKNLQLVKYTIDQSHTNGLRVAIHATELETARESVRAGADILVHSVDDTLVDQDFIQLIKKQGTIYTPAITVLEGLDKIVTQDLQMSTTDYQIADPFMAGSILDVQHIPDSLYPSRLQRWLKDPAGFVDYTKNSISIAQKNVKALQDAGVTIATGTDAGNPGTWHGASIFREIQLLSEAGLTSQEIINNSTLNGAKLMGLEASTGSIEVGKLADLVVLNSNPLEDISHLSRIQSVIKGGRKYDINDLSERTAEEIVQMQVVAYNQRDLEAFLSFYDEDIKIFNHPNDLIMDGLEAMKERYGQLFSRSQNLHVEIKNRMTIGNKVIDHESVVGITESVVEAIAIYEVVDQKIRNVWFVRRD